MRRSKLTILLAIGGATLLFLALTMTGIGRGELLRLVSAVRRLRPHRAPRRRLCRTQQEPLEQPRAVTGAEEIAVVEIVGAVAIAVVTPMQRRLRPRRAGPMENQ